MIYLELLTAVDDGYANSPPASGNWGNGLTGLVIGLVGLYLIYLITKD